MTHFNQFNVWAGEDLAGEAATIESAVKIADDLARDLPQGEPVVVTHYGMTAYRTTGHNKVGCDCGKGIYCPQFRSPDPEVHLTEAGIVALLEAIRVLGPDLGSVHPRFRTDLRLAATDLQKAIARD